jgi:hypothetical protein
MDGGAAMALDDERTDAVMAKEEGAGEADQAAAGD